MTFEERKAKYMAMSHDQLVAHALNTDYNVFLAANADFGKDEVDPRGHGKRIPYIGWYWRDVDFANGRARIGDCGEFTGFMVNNKWDYDERNMTDEEHRHVLALVDLAMATSSLDEERAILADLWDYVAGLKVKA